MEFFESSSYVLFFCLCWVLGEAYLEDSGKKLSVWQHFLVGWISFFLAIINIKMVLFVAKFLIK